MVIHDCSPSLERLAENLTRRPTLWQTRMAMVGQREDTSLVSLAHVAYDEFEFLRIEAFYKNIILP
ncbi:MAG: hypothetical protein OXL41_03090 [Nitrospinae bacterium]|nr:hypothetical protein [Nitrospinota bacterium]